LMWKNVIICGSKPARESVRPVNVDVE